MSERQSGAAAGADEAAIRCRDLAAMVAFYRDIIGLDVIEGDDLDRTILLGAGAPFAPPGRRVALVPAEADVAGNEDEAIPAPHHLSLTVADAQALERAAAWLRANGLAPEPAEHAWIGWRCLTVTDPEGNTVELSAPVRQRTLPAGAPAAD